MNELKTLVNKKLNPEITTPTPASQSVTTNYPVQYGWVCPKCGAVMAPNQTNCTFCVPIFNTTPTNPPITPAITCTSKGYSWD